MNTSRTIALLLIAFVPMTALADDSGSSDQVETLKSSLKSTMGFKVDNVRVTDDGTACISYRVNNDKGGVSSAKAVVQGAKVLRSTSGQSDFAKAWNSKCVSGA